MSTDSNSRNSSEDIAIIGMAGLFPGAKNLHKFWQNIFAKKESITHFSQASSGKNKIHPSDKQVIFVNAKGIITGIEKFDANFFGYSSKEAALTDPQHRLFLEVAWQALEDAGYSSDVYPGSIAVFAGAEYSTYLEKNILPNQTICNDFDHFQRVIATSPSFLATKTAYKLNLQGPSVSVSTACSTSLVAIIMACRHLRDYECDIAIAGSACIEVPQQGYLSKSEDIFSPDGHCRTFDQDANGTVPSDGIAVITLKRLADAIEDGDTIDAVIIGSAINNDGANKVGYTAPSVTGQADCITEAIAYADISPSSIGYIEAHGTGTTLGDPIEIAALTQAFSINPPLPHSCAISSVKSNIGHTYSTAGIAGVIKAVGALQHKILPANLYGERTNPKINFEDSPFYVNTETKPWQSEGPRRAGVSSFGIGGTNAHVIIEEAPEMASTPRRSRTTQLLMLSAKTATALEKMTQNLEQYIEQHQPTETQLADISYTLHIGRKTFSHRRAIACPKNFSTPFFDAKLNQTQHCQTATEHVVFMFPGQGSQFVDMGKLLYQEEPEFRKAVDFCCEQFQHYLDLDLRCLLFPTAEQAAMAEKNLQETQYTQPALFTIEYATAMLWIHWGIKPTVMIGHSIGEYVAAHLAGVFSLTDAIAIVAKRGQLISSLETGSMLAVGLHQAELTPLLTPDVSLAAVNTPELCVVSGSEKTVDDLQQVLYAQYSDSILLKRLRTSHAFHSQMMSPILNEFADSLAEVTFNAPHNAFISNVTGEFVTSEQVTCVDYWVSHLRNTVNFTKGIETLISHGLSTFINVGPGSSLSSFVQQIKKSSSPSIITVNSYLASEQQPCLYPSLATLWLNGATIDWSAFYCEEKRRRLHLPTYPFEGEEYWINPDNEEQSTPTLNTLNYADWFYQVSWYRHHRIDKSLIDDIEHGLSLPYTWLIFAGNTQINQAVIQQLGQYAKSFYLVKKSSNYTVKQNEITIDPKNKGDYLRLFDDVKMASNKPIQVLHLWNVTELSSVYPNKSVINERQYDGFYSLLFFTQACLEKNIKRTVNITLVGNHLYNVSGTDMVQPEKASLLGACRVIPSEQQNIKIQVIDLPSTIEPHTDGYVTALLYQANQIDSTNSLAFRYPYCWQQKLINIPNFLDHPIRHRFRQQGVYLITGGLGGMGLVLAEYLAETYHATLILLARSAATDQQNKNLKKIQQLGGKCIVRQNDIADLDKLRTTVNEVEKITGVIHGVIHAAGIPVICTATASSVSDIEKVFTAKIYGSFALKEIFSQHTLDFMLLCSSLSTAMSISNLSTYCAANSVLDAIANMPPNTVGYPIFTINWNTWEEVGMAINTNHINYLHSIGDHNMISSAFGKQLFHDIVNADINQVFISTQPINAYIKQYSSSSRKAKIKKDVVTNNNISISSILQNALGVKKIALHDDLFSLGLNSLLAIQAITRINENFPIKLTLPMLYEARTIASLTKLTASSSDTLVNRPIITLQQSGDKTPLFAIHPMGGTTFCFLPLASCFTKERPLYAIQDPAIIDHPTKFENLIDMARCYKGYIQHQQKTGPYLLSGASFGGTLAFEIGRQLQQQGEKVIAIILFDSWASLPDSFSDSKQFERIMEKQYNTLANQTKKTLSISADEWLELQWQRLQLLLNYQPIRSNIPLLLFKAKTLLPEYQATDHPYNYWDSYTAAPITRHLITGDHNTILYKPGINGIVEALQKDFKLV